jgi:hypothetical protein
MHIVVGGVPNLVDANGDRPGDNFVRAFEFQNPDVRRPLEPAVNSILASSPDPQAKDL